MKLDDFNSDAGKLFRSNNAKLKETFYIEVDESLSKDEVLTVIQENQAALTEMKVRGLTASSAEYARCLMVVEVAKHLLNAKHQLNEFDTDFLKSKDYQDVVSGLANYVAQNVKLGDGIKDALSQAMKEYRSSKWRFPDTHVMNDVHQQALAQLNQQSDPIGSDQDMTNKDFENIKENYVKQLRTILESEVDEAEIIIAAKGFAKSLQEMIEKIGRLQNEDLPPLSDQMRDQHGVDQSSSFQTQTHSALQGVMDALYAAKEEVDTAVEMMAKGQSVGIDMDADLSLDPELSADPELGLGDDLGVDSEGDIDAELDGLEDEFGGDEAAAGPEDEPLGRAKMEAAQQIKDKILALESQLAKRAKQ